MWKKLINMNDEYSIDRGSVFRFPADYPFESYVDFMSINLLDWSNTIALVVASGYKKGLVTQRLPVDAICQRYRDCLNAGWMKVNWNEWVYEDCRVSDVYVSEDRVVPISLPAF